VKAVLAIGSCVMKELMRKKDFFVLLIFMFVILGIMAAQNFFQIEGITRYIRDIGYSLVMLFSFIIAVVFSARQFPVEIKSRTIYPLLSKPLSRFTIILGKFWGCVLISVISYTLYFGVYLLFFIAETGTGNLVLMGQSYFFGILFLCLVSALVVFFSNFLTLSANVTLSFLTYFIVTGFSDNIRNAVTFSKGVLSYALGVLYYILPHFDFFDLRLRVTHEWDHLPLWVVASVALYALVYCGILLILSGYLFERKRF